MEHLQLLPFMPTNDLYLLFKCIKKYLILYAALIISLWLGLLQGGVYNFYMCFLAIYFNNLGDTINVSVYNSLQCWVVNKEGHIEIDKDSLGHICLELKDDDDSVVYGVLLGVDLDLNDLIKLIIRIKNIYYTAKKGLSLQENLSIKITIIKYYTLNL